MASKKQRSALEGEKIKGAGEMEAKKPFVSGLPVLVHVAAVMDTSLVCVCINNDFEPYILLYITYAAGYALLTLH